MHSPFFAQLKRLLWEDRVLEAVWQYCSYIKAQEFRNIALSLIFHCFVATTNSGTLLFIHLRCVSSFLQLLSSLLIFHWASLLKKAPGRFALLRLLLLGAGTPIDLLADPQKELSLYL